MGIWDNLIQIPQWKFAVERNDRLGMLGGEYLSMIMMGEPLLAVGREREDAVDQQSDVHIRPSSVNIAVPTLECE